jgi:hypothetical protein
VKACACSREIPRSWPRCRPCDRKAKRADRREQPAGVYLAILKLTSGRFIIKIGHTAQMRSKAGRLASDAQNNHGFSVEWAEIVRFLPEDDYHERVNRETSMIRAMRLDVYDETDEYFWAETYEAFVAMLGPEAIEFERRSTGSRLREFLASLDTVTAIV